MQISSSDSIYMAQKGIQNGYDKLNKNSEILATPNSPEIAGALIDNKTAENLVSANLKTIKAADERLGTLLDILA